MSTKTNALVPVTPLEVVADHGVSLEFAAARKYLQTGRMMAHGAAACMVMLGCELKRLHAAHPETRGRPKKTDAHRVISWAKLVEQELGISDDTATKYMALATEARKRLPEIHQIADKLLSSPLDTFTDEQRTEMVQQIEVQLPAESATQLMFEWGIAKKPGSRGGARKPETRKTELQLRLEAAAAFAASLGNEDQRKYFQLCELDQQESLMAWWPRLSDLNEELLAPQPTFAALPERERLALTTALRELLNRLELTD